MTKELQDKLYNKYPDIFKGRYKSIKENLIPFGLECGDGWYWLIDKLCSNLQWNTDHNNKLYVIKNKFLRVLVPMLDRVVQKIPGHYNFNRKTQINPLIGIRSFLVKLISRWRQKLEFIHIDANRYPQIEAVQVKEKFGDLRFYVNGASKEQQAVINWAESLSYSICEQCGSITNVGRTQGWITTLCKECAKDNNTWKQYEDII